MISKFFAMLIKHKFIAGLFFLAIIGGGYFGWQKINQSENEVRYATVAVQKGTLIVSVSGSGQVSVSNQADIKPKVSGNIVYLGAKNGQEVKTGTLIARLDAADAQKAARDAKSNLESAKISFAKLKQPADALSILQAENSLIQAKDSLTKLKLSQEITYQKALETKQKAEDDLTKAYEDGFNNISNTFLDLPGIMTGFNDMFFNRGGFDNQQSNIDWYLNQVSLANQDKATIYHDEIYTAYDKARAAYAKNFDDYKIASRTSDTATIESLILETYDTTKLIADAVKDSDNYIDFIQDDMKKYSQTIPSLMTTHQLNIDSCTRTTNSDLLNLLSIQTTIRTSKEAITNSEQDIKEMDQNNPIELSAAEQAIKEKEGSLAKLKAGADKLDIQSQELTIKQRENALLDAQQKLTDYFIRIPFDGVIAVVDVKKGDPASASTIIATLITKQRIAEISLNEVDVSKVKVGQKVTITFDAIEELSITGEVAEIDSIGTVSQGVVTYGVKIGFDTQDERVKPGMSLSAAIITDMKQNILIVPNSAVKSNNNGQYYVEILENNTPRSQSVEIGLVNDTMTEIINGLKEGDSVVTQTITANTNSKIPTQQNTGLRIPGIGGGGFGR